MGETRYLLTAFFPYRRSTFLLSYALIEAAESNDSSLLTD